MNNKCNKRGFSLVEVILVIAMISIIAVATLPYWTEASLSINDGYAEDMTKNIIRSAKSLAIAGRKDVYIKFKPDGTMIIGSESYKLPSNYTFNIPEVKKYDFDIDGKVTPSNETITIKRKDYLFDPPIMIK